MIAERDHSAMTSETNSLKSDSKLNVRRSKQKLLSHVVALIHNYNKDNENDGLSISSSAAMTSANQNVRASCKYAILTKKYVKNAYWSRDSVVGIATCYGLGDGGVGVRVPAGPRI
jgi:hypothetical protein